MHDPRSPELGPRPVSIDEPVHHLTNEQQPDLVGIKDNITLTPDERSHSRSSLPGVGNSSSATSRADDLVRLAIKCPSLADTTLGESTIVTVPSHFSIAHVKRQIERTWPGKPKAEGMRFFKSGQALSDHALVGNLTRMTSDDETTAIHLVIRPGAWGVSPHRASRSTADEGRSAWALPSSSRSEQASSSRNVSSDPQPAIPSIDIPRHTHSLVSASEQDRHMASVVESMDPAQYSTFSSLLSWAYARYVDIYEEEWVRAYGTVVPDKGKNEGTSTSSLEQLAREMACSVEDVASAIDLLETDVLLWDSLENEVGSKIDLGAFKYKQVDLHGLPYLLRVERNPAEERLRAMQARIERLRNLVLQMEKLINYQTLLNRTVPTSTRLAALGGESMERVQAASGVRRSAVRETPFQRFSLLDRSDVMKVLLASFFLSFKMAILLYVFTRGVSHVKMAMMGGVSLVYILYEAWTMLERRVRARRRDLRRATGDDNRVPRRGAAAGPMRNGDAATSAVAGEGDNRNGQTAAATTIRSPRSPIRHRVSSPFLLEYWIERAAYWNLAEEDREIGLRPPEGTRASMPTARASSAFVQGFNDFVVLPTILFLATLVPAIEQRRRRAIEQRDELIRTTADKVEEQERRLREAQEKDKEQHDKTVGVDDVDAEQREATRAPAAAVARHPTVLRSRYGQRVLQRRGQGRQIDIAQEIEAAAAAAANEDAENLDQADMGFL